MDRFVTELLESITANYREQLQIYHSLCEIAQLEAAVIGRGSMPELVGLLQSEHELLQRVRALDELQVQEKEKLRQFLPGRQISLDQLACVTETRVYLDFKEVMCQVSEMLRTIEEIKNKSLKALQELLRNSV